MISYTCDYDACICSLYIHEFSESKFLHFFMTKLSLNPQLVTEFKMALLTLETSEKGKGVKYISITSKICR